MSDQAEDCERRLRAVHQDLHDLRLGFTLDPHYPNFESMLWTISTVMLLIEFSKDLAAARKGPRSN
jgi:hypothetical protein